jgi:hypothetical protein
MKLFYYHENNLFCPALVHDNQAVKRNIYRFPADFMFQLTRKEVITNLRSQIVTSSAQNVDNQDGQATKTVDFTDNQQNVRSRSQFVTFERINHLPHAFTEQGIAMLSSVLNSRQAIEINIAIMRVFVEMRKLFLNHQELMTKVAELANKVGEHDQYIQTLYEYLKSFDEEQKRRIEWENRKPIGFIQK